MPPWTSSVGPMNLKKIGRISYIRILSFCLFPCFQTSVASAPNSILVLFDFLLLRDCSFPLIWILMHQCPTCCLLTYRTANPLRLSLCFSFESPTAGYFRQHGTQPSLDSQWSLKLPALFATKSNQGESYINRRLRAFS
ncbi:hypothetical protein DFH11DRAFT_1742725 [Phellopilus nigrolimitatus]|nr:hypothetical protein DFH11DRAFT_1742725 [Phellopilus nigrolimitatus]